MQIKIAHEAPKQILNNVRDLTDYCYALVHLFESEPEYFQYFVNSLKIGRKVLLDNSIFELGEAFDSDKFAQCIITLLPTEYIIPDVLEDSEATMANVDKWLKEYKRLPGTKIGVVQGKTYQDIVNCYKFMVDKVDKIAISFDYSLYDYIGVGESRFEKCATGRPRLIAQMLRDYIIEVDAPHHLLGAALPSEFSFYKKHNLDFIETLDTSNPVVHGLKMIEYNPGALKTKDTTKLVDLFNDSVSESQLKNIVDNIIKFRALVNG